MVYRLLFILFLFSSNLLFAQLEDDFSDGDFTNNPEWLGDVSDFIVNTDGELQLNASAAGNSTLYTALEIPDSLEWDILARLNFAPSGSNLLRIYLQADDPDLLSANGYYMEVGETGSNDAFRIYRQDGAGNETLLATATLGAMGSQPAVARLQIKRNAIGSWSWSADYTGGFNFTPEPGFTDNTYGAGNAFFGFYMTYTSSRVDEFFFDDIKVKEIVPDTEAPNLIDLQVLDERNIDLSFNEALDELSIITNNFTIDNGIGNPMSANLDPVDPGLVHLSLASDLQSGQTYTLSANNISDLAGNSKPSQSRIFDYIRVEIAAPYDILITEIMADPSPAIGLPEVEFFELLNTSNKSIDLASINLIKGSNAPVAFEPFILSPGEYVIVCDDSDEALLSPFGTTAIINSFPGLTNSGDRLELQNTAGTTIHTINYQNTWYQDNDKDDGGWTLEMISPQQICKGIENWQASLDPSGGTPGRVNSVFDNITDTDGPQLIRVFPASNNELRIYFDETLDPAVTNDPGIYMINGLSVVAATTEGPLFSSVLIQTNQDFVVGEIYTLNIETDLTDCLGNPIAAGSTARFGLPETIAANDLILNEILFYPAVGGSRFIELYNRSDKIINTDQLFIATRDEVDQIDDIKPVDTEFLLFPGEYVVFSPDPLDVFDRYTVQTSSALLENSLPSYDSDADEVIVYALDGIETIIVDELSYTNDFHNPLLDNERGVSIERINQESATQSAANWHSAAQSAGFATPTYQNSQFMTGMATASDLIEIPNPRLSPDNDGFEDFLLINYQTDLPDYTANIKIFDTDGRQIKNLIQNELLGASGRFIWEGDTDDNNRARIGIYIIFIELFTPQGDIRTFKETCVVAGKLN